MLFKDISYLELWWPFCSAERNNLCTFGRGYPEEQFCRLFWIWTRCLKIFNLEHWQPSSSAEQNHLCNFYQGHYEEQFCEIILKIWTVVQEEISFKDISYLELRQPLCSVERNHLRNFGRRHHKEQFCEIILNLDQWFRRCRLKIFLI